jgi:hypothetical protein
MTIIRHGAVAMCMVLCGCGSDPPILTATVCVVGVAGRDGLLSEIEEFGNGAGYSFVDHSGENEESRKLFGGNNISDEAFIHIALERVGGAHLTAISIGENQVAIGINRGGATLADASAFTESIMEILRRGRLVEIALDGMGAHMIKDCPD